MDYIEFLKTKIELAVDSGFEVDKTKINKALKPHQADAVAWALRGGRRALFESFGLGKTVQELEFCHLAAEHENGRALIVLPLGVKQEFTQDAVNVLGYESPRYVRTMEEVKEAKEQIQYYRKGEISEEERNILREIEVRIDQLDFDEAEILMKRWEEME